MKNVIFENESVLVSVDEETAETSAETGEAEETEATTLSGYDENVQFLSKHPIINIFIRPTDKAGSFEATNWFALLIIIPIIIIIFIKKATNKRKAQEAAFEQKYAEKTAFDYYSTGDMNTGYSNSSYGSGSSYDSYSNANNSGYNSYNDYSNNNYNSGASSAEPFNPYANKFEGKTPDEARKIYIKYMKNFHSDTGDGSDDEDVKQINAAYDEYKKAHGIK
jgi:hypothetical protein